MEETKAMMVSLDRDGDGKIGMEGKCVCVCVCACACVCVCAWRKRVATAESQPGAVHSSVLKCLTGSFSEAQNKYRSFTSA